jgi:hypothetical protein
MEKAQQGSDKSLLGAKYRWYDVTSWEEKHVDCFLSLIGNNITVLFAFLFFMFFLGFDLMLPNNPGGAGW